MSMDFYCSGYGKLARTLKVLAESLPEMMSAMLRPEKGGARPLAGITDRIAEHLNAEVCSIFLATEGGKNLVCREAHGYEEEVEGKPHSKTEGLTGRIFSNRCELVLNYSVQDRTLGWAGAYDNELQTHCWSLLGVPIMSSQQSLDDNRRACLGVLKLENKRAKWSSITDGEYLKKIAEIDNTPRAIHDNVVALCREDNRFDFIQPLAEELLRSTDSIGAIIRTGKVDDSMRRNIVQENLESNLESIKWHTDCLHHEIHESIRSGECSSPQLRKLAKMTHAFRFALRTYEPFSDEDLMLARHVSAMLAAVLDIDLLVYFKGWERIAHSLNHVSSDFFEHLERVVDFHLNSPEHSECYKGLAVLLDSAIYISGTKGSRAEVAQQEADYIARQIRSRSSGYRRLARLKGLQFVLEEDIADPQKLYKCDSGQFKAALDVVVHNAFHYGASNITLRISDADETLRIDVLDDGVGLPADFEIKRGNRGKQPVPGADGRPTMPSGEGMGLFNTRHSLQSFGAALEHNSRDPKGAVFSIIFSS